MPCEGCACSFTVFRRKRSCTDCKRFYCSNCLRATRRSLLCQRCAIFAKRPLLRADLQQLKPKDLIFYLQSKHISTAGCVEKDELVGLVLVHVQQADASSPGGGSSSSNSSRSPEGEPAHSFDSLKQTCQNFFTNITDNISDSFAAFDGKSSAQKPQQTQSQSQGQQANNRSNSRYASGRSSGTGSNGHISDQPRVSTREIPTYASFQQYNRPSAPTSTSPSNENAGNAPVNAYNSKSTNNSNSNSNSNTSSSPTTSAVHSPNTNSNSSVTSASSQLAGDAVTCETIARNEAKSDCECSDDEIFTTFSERVSTRAPSVEVRQSGDGGEAVGPSSCSSAAVPPVNTKVDLVYDAADESSHSSFEELGAIGGISDESKAATDTNSGATDQWQLLDAQRTQSGEEEPPSTATVTNVAETEALQVVSVATAEGGDASAPPRVKKVTRRRSDTYLNRRRPLSDDDSPTSSGYGAEVRGIVDALSQVHEHIDEEADVVATEAVQRPRVHCKRCGKNKMNIRRHVEKMRVHLESAQMSESDIKQELGEFLAYLEKRMLSMDHSDTETAASSLTLSGAAAATNFTHMEFMAGVSPLSPPAAFDDNEGIHVYAAPEDYVDDMGAFGRGDTSRFINLEDYDSLKELECLTVKQLKEVLMLNRVDYKGCCEKQELLDRVERLWKHLKLSPAVDKLQTDELCKICMDAPIECIILECGHMATCTGCGKVLSECPICRQYIVRVVRFFRA